MRSKIDLDIEPHFFMKEAQNLFNLIQEKHARAPNDSERIVIKWFGFLIYFLSMHKNQRVRFAENEAEINETIKQLTKDLHELKKRTTAANN